MYDGNPPSDDDALSDSELIDRVRVGDPAATEELYRRHRAAAHAFAVRVAGRDLADDVTSEAFSRVFRILQAGGGPDVAFRPYLYTTVRTTHIDLVRKDARYVWLDDYSPVENRLEPAQPEGLHEESSLLAAAFRSLPERWQTVIWHTAVEGDRLSDVGQMLGLSASATAALNFRAREGLRQAYLAQHVGGAGDEACRVIRPLLPAYVRGKLGRRQRAQVEAHLDECAECSAIVAELGALRNDLGAVLAPALVGVPVLAGVAHHGWLAGLLPRWQIGGTPVAATATVVAVASVAVAVGVSHRDGGDEVRAVQPTAQSTHQRPEVRLGPTSRPSSRPTTGPTTAPTAGPTTGPTTGPSAGPTPRPSATTSPSPSASERPSPKVPAPSPTPTPTPTPTPSTTSVPTADVALTPPVVVPVAAGVGWTEWHVSALLVSPAELTRLTVTVDHLLSFVPDPAPFSVATTCSSGAGPVTCDIGRLSLGWGLVGITVRVPGATPPVGTITASAPDTEDPTPGDNTVVLGGS